MALHTATSSSELKQQRPFKPLIIEGWLIPDEPVPKVIGHYSEALAEGQLPRVVE